MEVVAFLFVHALCFCTVALGWSPQHIHINLKQFPRVSLLSLDSIAPSTSLDTRCDQDSNRHDALPEMIPVTDPPLLLLQSDFPIISKDECDLLSRYFESQYPTDIISTEKREAELILQRVREIIDTVTNCPSHAGEMQMPRYVRYDAGCTSLETFVSSKFVDALLPDGLHVDTNNGKLFRHITAILYLTDNRDGPTTESPSDLIVGGGTTFPLAVPFGSVNKQSASSYDVASSAAASLLNRGIHHTKTIGDEVKQSEQEQLEHLAINVFRRETSNLFRVPTEDRSQGGSHGIRVMPQAGKLIYFHNIDKDGRPDPSSFHGGEELTVITSQSGSESKANDHKSILVFFKEIPVEKIKDLDSFADEVRKAREFTVDKYYS